MGKNTEEIELVNDQSWVIKTLAAGTLIGAVVGLAGAFILTKQAEKNQTSVTVTPTDGIKIGVLVFGLLRAIGQLGED
jgi:Kef-type K+ transport system membrane component KefB